MITVLRIGHRLSRDKRITTHVALVARAFGADEILISTKDKTIVDTVNSITHRFGGSFQIKTGVDPKKTVKNWKGSVVHLTMYGDQLETTVAQLDLSYDILVIVGAEKVPPFYYEHADFNIAVGNQPHSEVAALALFLDRITKGAWSSKQFQGKLQILPSNTQKKVVSNQKNG